MRQIFPAVVLIAVAAGCNGDGGPTEPHLTKPGAGVSYDGGFTMGSGNRSDTSTMEQATTSEIDTAAGDTTPERGGFTMGSGN